MNNILQRIHQRFDTECADYVAVTEGEFIKEFYDQIIIEVLTEVVPKILGEKEEIVEHGAIDQELWRAQGIARNMLIAKQYARFKQVVEEMKNEN